MQIERLIRIIFLLINKEYLTAQEIADYCGVSKRTILRDINTLSLAGIPVWSSKGNGGGIGILKEYTLDKTALSGSERDNLIHGLQVLEAASFPDARQALDKISALFKISTNESWIDVDFSFWGSGEKGKLSFRAIQKAVLNKHVIRFDYYTSELQHSIRVAEPLRLVFKEQTWYIQGWCRMREDYRLFRISRMKHIEILDEFFERTCPADLPIQSNYAASYEMQTFKLRFQPEIAYRLFDEYQEDQIHLCEDGTYLVTYTYAMNEWLINHILSFGKYVEVLEPVSFHTTIKAHIKEILSLYS